MKWWFAVSAGLWALAGAGWATVACVSGALPWLPLAACDFCLAALYGVRATRGCSR